MNYRKIPQINRLLSRVVLGGRFGEQDDTLSFDMLDTFVELGGNVIDTANAYANGKSEILLGKWFSKRNNREQIVLIDKGCHPRKNQPKRVSPRCIQDDIQESLARLQSSYIDIFLLHRDDETVPVEPIIETLNEEIVYGHILAFGASNWNYERISKANNYAVKNNLIGFCASSYGFSLAIPKNPMWPGVIYLNSKIREWHIRTQVPLFAWSSQARGWFSGNYVLGKRYDPDVERVYTSQENLARLRRTQNLAKQKGVTPVQIALAYVLNQPFPTFALIGPESLSELCESIAAPELYFSSKEVNYLEKNENNR